MWTRLVFCLAVATACACGRDEPEFLSVLAPTDTLDAVGPYRVEARVFSPNGVRNLVVRLQSGSDANGFGEVELEPIRAVHDGGTYFAELPGQPIGTETRFYLLLVDGVKKGGGALVHYPRAAPSELLSFRVLGD